MKNIALKIQRNVPEFIRKDEKRMRLFTRLTFPFVKRDEAFFGELKSYAEIVEARVPDGKFSGIMLDMLNEYYIRYVIPDEYVRWGFEKKDSGERGTYWTGQEVVRQLSSSKNNIMPKDKYGRFLLFQDYVKRDVICVKHDDDPAAADAFLEKHGKFVAKPLVGTKGHGIMVVDQNNMDEFKERLASSRGGYILEEMILQGEELARFHPKSVNTIRFASMMDKEHHRLNAFALLRTGAGESFVDNVGAGGVAALIDTNTGIIISDGICGDKHYQAHPDTGVVFKGSVIPAWDELLKLADDVHGRYTKQKVMGFDFAWTIRGWDIVEINPAPSFSTFQAITGKGIRAKVKEAGIDVDE